MPVTFPSVAKAHASTTSAFARAVLYVGRLGGVAVGPIATSQSTWAKLGLGRRASGRGGLRVRLRQTWIVFD